MSDPIPFRVFYSWQSDLPGDGNNKLIRAALDEALAVLNGDPNLSVHASRDEATRDLPGSPHIAAAILKKIQEADVFVCDLSKVAEVTNHSGDRRSYCNPNVAIELGFAIRVLGWDRIVLVFNKDYGPAEDFPFDARGHRALGYGYRPEVDDRGKLTQASIAAMKNARGNLKNGLLSALTEVLKHRPKRPEDQGGASAAKIKRDRDVQQLKKLSIWIHLGIMDIYIERLGYARVTNAGLFMYERLEEVMESSSFYISDSELRTRLEAFLVAFRASRKYAGYMEPGKHEGRFYMPGDTYQSTEQMEQVEHTMAQATPLRRALEDLKGYIAENYVEIDLLEAGNEGRKLYEEYEARMQAALDGN